MAADLEFCVHFYIWSSYFYLCLSQFSTLWSERFLKDINQIIWSCVLKSSNVFYFKQKNNEDYKTIWSSSCLSLTLYPTNLYLAHFSLNVRSSLNKQNSAQDFFIFFFSLPVVFCSRSSHDLIPYSVIYLSI